MPSFWIWTWDHAPKAKFRQNKFVPGQIHGTSSQTQLEAMQFSLTLALEPFDSRLSVAMQLETHGKF